MESRGEKSTRSGKEEKMSTFAVDMMLHIQNPKVSTKKLDLINKFSKVPGYKRISFVHTNNELSEKEIK